MSGHAGPQQTKSMTKESSDNQSVSDDSSSFTVALESATSESPVEENTSDPATNLRSNVTDLDGNSLPEGVSVDMRQELLLLQSLNINQEQALLLESIDENFIPSIATQIQGSGLLGSNKVSINSDLIKQDYFNIVANHNKDVMAALPAGNTSNHMVTQVGLTHIASEMNDRSILNLTESHQPMQGISASLSSSSTALAATTQTAVIQSQMTPLNLSQNAWETNLASRLQMLIGQNVQTAEIRLDPPDLGILEIKIKITNDVATVNISSQHAHVKEALEAAIPKLREMFEQSGVALGDVNVRQESFSQQQSKDENSSIAMNSSDSESMDEINQITRRIESDNLLDIYA